MTALAQAKRAVSRFPFGRPAARRPPRVPTCGATALLVVGVYPSALHIRWRRPDGAMVGALAIDDEPTVFWDGADATRRIEQWQQTVHWKPAWGSVAAAGGNGSSGRHVIDHVLQPLGIAPENVYFTDCLPTYFVKPGLVSQAQAIRGVYGRVLTHHRVLQRILALTAAIWHNDHTGQPVKRSLTAYDH
jgi:hypothetical protein